jgi:hypothetical protein
MTHPDLGDPLSQEMTQATIQKLEYERKKREHDKNTRCARSSRALARSRKRLAPFSSG